MVDQAIIEATAAALQSLDLSALADELAELQAESQRLSAAEAQASSRTTEIHDMLSDLVSGKDGGSVADHLLAGGSAVNTLAPSKEALNAELRALGQGQSELRKRQERVRSSIESIRTAAQCALGPAFEELVAELRNETREHATRLLEIYASLSAIGAATKSTGRVEAREIENAIKGARGQKSMWPLPYNGTIEVPTEVVSLLELAAEVGAVAQLRVMTQVRP